jgi:hypothetical protein
MVLLPTGERIEDWASLERNSTMKTCSHKPTPCNVHEAWHTVIPKWKPVTQPLKNFSRILCTTVVADRPEETKQFSISQKTPMRGKFSSNCPAIATSGDPDFEAVLPRLGAINNVVSFLLPLVPQPIHRGIARGAG